MGIKFFINLLIGFIIYSHAFTALGNTTYRANSSGQIVFSLIPMFTEGFIGPIRTLYLVLSQGQIFNFLNLFFEFMTNFWSPYSIICFIYLLNKNY
jgi:hypothetical protein